MQVLGSTAVGEQIHLRLIDRRPNVHHSQHRGEEIILRHRLFRRLVAQTLRVNAEVLLVVL